MSVAETLKTIGILFGIGLGIIGAGPQIIQWFKPKPYLMLVYADFKSLRVLEENPKLDDRYRLKLIVSNNGRFWRRNGDATGVKAECHVIDMNREQCGGIQTFQLSKNLPVGENVNKEFTFRPQCKEELNPHTLILKISCDEGQKIKQEISFDCLRLDS